MTTIPARIGNFEVIRRIDSGGMGTVYLGRDPELDRQVAIKVIREEVHDQDVLERFFREARAAAALRHPNIITIYASGQHDHQPYMAMEFVEGDSIAGIIKQRRNVALSDKISYLEQICAGLHFAHRAGIVHRDIKPANIMVDREGVVRILDFGIARIDGSAMTQDGALVGSLNYMSPEQMLGRPVDHRSDIFSVGALAYELLCYQQAFKGGLNDGLLQRLPHEDPPSLTGLYPGLPPALEHIVMRALEKAPEKRFQDLSEMRSAIVDVQAGLQPADERTADERTIVIPRPGALPPPSRPSPAAAPDATPWAGTAAQPPVTAASSVSGPAQFGGAITPEVPRSQTQGLQLQKESRPATARSASNPPKRPPVVATPPPRTARRTPSRRWILVGSAAGALIVAGSMAIPWLTPAPPDPVVQARRDVEAAMERFRTAYRNRNLEGVVQVFPTLPRDTRRAMQRSFNDCLVYEVTFSEMQVEVNPADATLAQADVRSLHTCTPNAGGRQSTTGQRDVFTLKKSGDTWRIDSAVRGAQPLN